MSQCFFTYPLHLCIVCCTTYLYVHRLAVCTTHCTCSSVRFMFVALSCAWTEQIASCHRHPSLLCPLSPQQSGAPRHHGGPDALRLLRVLHHVDVHELLELPRELLRDHSQAGLRQAADQRGECIPTLLCCTAFKVLDAFKLRAVPSAIDLYCSSVHAMGRSRSGSGMSSTYTNTVL